MKVAFFSSKKYDYRFFTPFFMDADIEYEFFEARLSLKTVGLANGFDTVCAFVNDDLGAEVLSALAASGIKLVALRSAGFNHVDLATAAKNQITVVRVPEYSPHAVAEHTLALLLGVNRKTHKAYNRVREGNFELGGLIGFDLYEKTVGIIGAGKIGKAAIDIFKGFGCDVLVTDPALELGMLPSGAKVVTLERLFEVSEVITLHCPLTPNTHHMICSESIQKMKDGVVIVNTSRGGLIDTSDVIDSLKSQKIGALAIDVYEEEADLFFSDLSDVVIQDDVFSRLLTFPNVLVTGHQAFFTNEALSAIADTTTQNIVEFFKDGKCAHSVGMHLIN